MILLSTASEKMAKVKEALVAVGAHQLRARDLRLVPATRESCGDERQHLRLVLERPAGGRAGASVLGDEKQSEAATMANQLR